MTDNPKYADVETSSDDYANRFSGRIGEWLLTVQTLTVARLVRSMSEDRQARTVSILDVGGGHGQIALPMSALGYPVTVLGSAPECFELQRERLARGLFRSMVGDLAHAPCEDRSYSVVVSVRLLSHCDEWRDLIAEFCRLAKDAVIVDYPPLVSFNFFYPILFKIKKKLEGNTRTFTIFTHKEVLAEFEKHGFILKERVGEFFWPMVIHRKLANPKISAFLEKIASFLRLRELLGSPVLACFERRSSTNS